MLHNTMETVVTMLIPIPRAYLSPDWKSVPPSHPFCLPTKPSPHWQPPVCSLYSWGVFCFIFFNMPVIARYWSSSDLFYFEYHTLQVIQVVKWRDFNPFMAELCGQGGALYSFINWFRLFPSWLFSFCILRHFWSFFFPRSCEITWKQLDSSITFFKALLVRIRVVSIP